MFEKIDKLFENGKKGENKEKKGEKGKKRKKGVSNGYIVERQHFYVQKGERKI